MKKKTKIILVLLILILVLPIPNFAIKDGGTKTYTALTYKIVDWNRLVGSGNIYEATEFYFIPYNFFSLDRLWNSKTDRYVPENTGEDNCPLDHSPASEEQLSSDAYLGGWCGNTQATIVIEGKEYTFMLGDSITLNALYLNHSFSEKPCQCESPVQIKAETGTYFLNLEKCFIRSDKGQGQLTQEQVKEIKEIIERQTQATLHKGVSPS